MSLISVLDSSASVLSSSCLVVQREDIRFGDGEAGTVWLEVEVHNRGGQASQATGMSVGVAPFGAFVESEPVGTLEVPSVPAGGSRVVKAWFRRRADDGLEPIVDGGRWRGPAGDVQTWSVSREDVFRWRERATGSAAWRAAQRRNVAQAVGSTLMRMVQKLMPGCQASPTVWAGNFDVHVGEVEAERHCSAAVELEAGVRNMAMFVVGTGPDSYRFNFLGDGAAWKPALWIRGSMSTAQRWMDFSGQDLAILLVEPPMGTTKGLLAVSVEQRSTGKQALVEFGFGVDCIPPGCFRSRE